MIKLFSILFLSILNITQLSIFEIEGVFSSGHVNAIDRHFEETLRQDNHLFVFQYNAKSFTEDALIDLKNILKANPSPKAVWVGPNKTEVDLSLIQEFDFVGLSPGTLISSTDKQFNFFDICNSNNCSDGQIEIVQEEGVYKGYLVVGSLGAFIENLGKGNIQSNLSNLKISNFSTVSFDLNSEQLNEIKFIKPSLAERFYIAIANPLFTYFFFALGFALIGLELFAIGPGMMAFFGALLIGLSSITFEEFGLNYYGLFVFFISFLMYIKILSRGYFGFLGLVSLALLHFSSIVMFSSYNIPINQVLMLFASLVIAFFYFIAIPTVIRSRLTTDTSAMSSFVGKKVKLLEVINDKKGLVTVNQNKIVVSFTNEMDYRVNSIYELREIDGKLTI